MVKHTPKILQILPTNCLSVFDHFVGLALKGLTLNLKFFNVNSKTIHSRNRSNNPPKFESFGIAMWHLS